MQQVKIYTASPSDLSPPVQSESFCVDMVMASDYAELEEKFMALAVENELARKAVQAFCDVVGDNTEVISEEVGRDGVLVILEAMKATGNTPATDAFLAEVRAQGVEMFADKYRSQLTALPTTPENIFDAAHVKLSYQIFDADEFAAQLRKESAQ
ncbi:hypothetical protein AB8G97_07865 [Salmonella enterica]